MASGFKEAIDSIIAAVERDRYLHRIRTLLTVVELKKTDPELLYWAYRESRLTCLTCKSASKEWWIQNPEWEGIPIECDYCGEQDEKYGAIYDKNYKIAEDLVKGLTIEEQKALYKILVRERRQSLSTQNLNNK